MPLRHAVICLMAGISAMISTPALATIDFPVSAEAATECKGSYELGCTLFQAENARREMWIFFDGTIEENGGNGNICGIRTAKLAQELGQAAIAAGASASDVQITKIRYSYLGARTANEYRCSYEIKTLRRDLRFTAHKFNRRFWTSEEDRKTVCMDDVRKAQAIPNSIGATKWITAALLQGYMCETNYALMGLDRIENDENGKEVLVKFGSKKPVEIKSTVETDNQLRN